mgnify:CR=1 FL=1
MPNAEIVAIGSELLLGQIVDTNSTWMAQRLTSREYISGGAPTPSITQSSGRSDDTATVAPSESKVRSLSLDVTSTDVNAYLQEICDAPVSAKDFRTWAGTVLAAVALEELERTEPQARHDKRLVRAIERVSQRRVGVHRHRALMLHRAVGQFRPVIIF